jgi:hypothetical protein
MLALSSYWNHYLKKKRKKEKEKEKEKEGQSLP